MSSDHDATAVTRTFDPFGTRRSVAPIQVAELLNESLLLSFHLLQRVQLEGEPALPSLGKVPTDPTRSTILNWRVGTSEVAGTYEGEELKTRTQGNDDDSNSRKAALHTSTTDQKGGTCNTQLK